jgi:hypothetical protein
MSSSAPPLVVEPTADGPCAQFPVDLEHRVAEGQGRCDGNSTGSRRAAAVSLSARAPPSSVSPTRTGRKTERSSSRVPQNSCPKIVTSCRDSARRLGARPRLRRQEQRVSRRLKRTTADMSST